MGDEAVTLEDSKGKIIRAPSAAEIRSMLASIGRGQDHCVLDLGPSGGFVQAAGSPGRLVLQYRDDTGMYESVSSDLDAAAVERVFLDAMKGDFAWKGELQFNPMEEGPEATNAGDGAGPSTAPAYGPRKSLAEELLDAAKGQAVNKLKGLVGKGIRGLFDRR
jgi:hypothetical protein